MQPRGIARPRVIRGTRAKSLPLLPSGPGGVYDRPLHEARGLTIHNRTISLLPVTEHCLELFTEQSLGRGRGSVLARFGSGDRGDIRSDAVFDGRDGAI